MGVLLSNQNTMTIELALFPLTLFLLPGEKFQLHIFEYRYKQLLKDCEKSNSSFGIPFVQNNNLLSFGSLVKITDELTVHPDGSSDIEIQCEEVFKIKTFHTQMGEKLYPGGEVVMIDTEVSETISKDLMNEFGKFLQKTSIELPLPLFSVHLDVYDVGRLLPMTGLEKIALIKAPTSEKKESILMNKLKILDKLIEQEKSVQNNFFLN